MKKNQSPSPHYYLDKLPGKALNKRPDAVAADSHKFKRERKKYGFDEREVWNLDLSFYCWLYERLRLYLDTSPVNLDYEEITYKDKTYSLKELIDMIIERLEFALSPDYNDFNQKQLAYVEESAQIWAVIISYVWW